MLNAPTAIHIPVWIIDPIDGTSNFIRGSADFSIMVALAQSGRTLAGWIFAPLFDCMAEAVAGEGARLNGRFVAIEPGAEITKIAVTHPNYRSERDRELFAALESHPSQKIAARGAGLEYVDLARGLTDAAVFTWDNPWDHAAGLLFHSEAGGCNGCRSGGFLLTGNNDLPILAARSEASLSTLRGLVTSFLS